MGRQRSAEGLEVLTVWHDEINDGGEPSIGEVARQSTQVGVEEPNLPGCLISWLTQGSDVSAHDHRADEVRVEECRP